MHFLLGLLLTGLATFLILIILVQRGRGGGLSGALGGMGGQSAFGTKAGDAFTKITIGVSIAWIVCCIITSLVLGRGGNSAFNTGQTGPGSGPAATTPAVPGTSTDPGLGGVTPSAEVDGGLSGGVDGNVVEGETATGDTTSPTNP